jgi:hypothetical protein
MQVYDTLQHVYLCMYMLCLVFFASGEATKKAHVKELLFPRGGVGGGGKFTDKQ